MYLDIVGSWLDTLLLARWEHWGGGGGGICDAGGDVRDVTREHRMHPSSELHQLLVSGMTLSVSLSVAACL